MNPIIKIDIPEVKKLYSGKVRDLYPVDDEHMLIVSTDRVSAFDYIFPNGIPGKGVILNTISSLLFKNMSFIKNHIVEDNFTSFPAPYSNYPELFKDRAVIVKRTKRIDFECVARGYIIGSGWKEYKEKGSVSGVVLPSDLKIADKLPETIFTPATKADFGHDMNVSIDVLKETLGDKDTELLKDMTVKAYEYGRSVLEKAGIILADTKFEFGYYNGEIILIDEVMTPDSSRFWDMSKYEVGKSPVSFDKQFIRDYIDTTPWDKNSPPPPLPDEIVTKTAEKYGEILNRIKDMFK
jgi:phosphoribosylaminoimidazole-succinocarboxamide synthase